MATEYDGDAFISYAHVDNVELDEKRGGWVTNLQRALEARVAQLYGAESQIWWDPKLQGNDYFADTLEQQLQRVKAFVAVVSPRYVKSEWGRREIAAFCHAAEQHDGLRVQDKARIFKVLKTPVSRELHPPELQSLLGYEFFKEDPVTGKMRELDEIFGPDAEKDFWLKLDDLAHDICELLKLLPPPPDPVAPRGSVYLALTTTELKDRRDAIQRDLVQHGYTVLPDRSLPTTSGELETAIREDLARCRLSIHMVGRTYSLVPEGGLASIIELQNELAIERTASGHFSRLIWIPPGVQVDDERQRKVLEHLRMDPRMGKDADLLETPLEDLRTMIGTWLARSETPARVVGAARPEGSPPHLYLIYDQRDADAVAPYADFLFKDFEVIHPSFDGSDAEIAAYHDDNLRSCHAALIFYGAAGEPWLRGKLRELQKCVAFRETRTRPSVGVCLIAPRTPGKERFRTHEATLIPQWDGLATDALQSFVTGLTCPDPAAASDGPDLRANPFPGLRPFEADEEHLFFGREKEIAELLRRLGSHRFLSVTGTSGCGKSSLVRSGLIPSLHSGLLSRAGSSWRIAIMRPGEDPIGHLAAALDFPDVLGQQGELASTSRVLLEATLRRGSLGVVDAVRQAHLSPRENVLLIVDQFEELFRFRHADSAHGSREDAAAFVKLLLEASAQRALPIYVVITMRSDFIGDCMRYPGLPEAVNEGQYLVPRMTRDGMRLAITGPVAVAGQEIAPRLVLRLLNDVGDDQDALPLVQHVLMRTWDHWAAQDRADLALDLANYEAVGTLKNALSNHAEEAFADTGDGDGQRLAERMFRALTDTFTDPRGVRRPTAVAELAAICEAPEADVIRVVEVFRRPGRSFLMPPPDVPLDSEVVIDVSHESLMRCWTRLIAWAQQERASIALYVRLAREATWHEEGAAGLWDDPELELGLRWRREHHPTAAWARRYDDSFDRAMHFLDLSEQQRDRLRAERRTARLRRLVLARSLAAAFLVVSLVIGYLYRVARREGDRAERNLALASDAVGQLLVASDRNQNSVGADVPEMERFRRELLERAKPFYAEFISQQPGNDTFVTEMGFAHFRLGEIYRMLDAGGDAEREYRAAITAFADLAQSHPDIPAHRRALANAYNSLGELLRPAAARRDEAEKAYGSALTLQATLTRQAPDDDSYRQELARTHYNRGILVGSVAEPGDAAFHAAEADFREAIRLLEPLTQSSGNLTAGQGLARAYNNLAALLAQGAQDRDALAAARPLYEKAIATHQALIARDPRNREYKFELATFSNNYAELLRELGAFEPARASSTTALQMLDDLVRPAPSLGIEQADAHNLRARILQSDGSPAALIEYRTALTVFRSLAVTDDAAGRPEFHLRYGDLLANLASLRRERPGAEEPRRLLTDAVQTYIDFGLRPGHDGSSEAHAVLDTLSRVIPELSETDRAALKAGYDRLQQRAATPNPQ